MGEEKKKKKEAIPTCPIVEHLTRSCWRCINTPHGGAGTAI